MSLTGYYTPKGVLYSGEQKTEDGLISITHELFIPYERNRFSNPLGRLLGPKGATVKWLRAETNCDIIVHTNDVRFLKVDSKVTVKSKAETREEARAQLDHAVDLVCAIIDSTNPGNVFMSDFQLFHPEEAQSSDIAWQPTNFTRENSAPTMAAPSLASAAEILADVEKKGTPEQVSSAENRPSAKDNRPTQQGDRPSSVLWRPPALANPTQAPSVPPRPSPNGMSFRSPAAPLPASAPWSPAAPWSSPNLAPAQFQYPSMNQQNAPWGAPAVHPISGHLRNCVCFMCCLYRDF